ncbi:MAG: TetR family transcriptional regulator [Anaerolineae bacterium]|jgi:AcrR family transcriptional regulator|nr:TetR family transcriptional regulator [Anaerolineae bacterium]
MTDSTLTPERILEAAEEVLRRYGPDKTTVVDVARALGVSHGSVYRHFPSKAALRDAVTERWLLGVSLPLAAVANESISPLTRLRHWFDLLVTTKRRWSQQDPELFATYLALAAESREVVREHVTTLIAQLITILNAGVASGVFYTDDVPTTARALFHATARFHDPVHANHWADPEIDSAYEGVWTLLVRALQPD